MEAKWLAVARGDVPPDLVLTGARVLSVFTREWLPVDVAVSDGHVVGLGAYDGPTRLDLDGAYLTPGFIDGHVHLESSKLMVDQFARAVVPHGTTAAVADPHEIANVLGAEGVHWLLEACSDLPLDVFLMAPPNVPASPHESPRRAFTPGDLAGLLRRRRVLGVAEMMNFPGVVAGDEAELAKLRTGLGTHVDGHAPGLTGKPLNAYVAAGIASDHESTTAEEALEKRRLGMWVMLREASGARNLLDLLPVVREHGLERCLFCTDDREPDFIVEEGHVNQMVRLAVQHGVRPEDALVLATLHPALCHGLRGLGAIAPGYQADLLAFDDLRTFRPRLVLKRGRPPEYPEVHAPEWARQTVRVGPVDERTFEVRAVQGPIRVIEVRPGQLVTGCVRVEPTVHDGRIIADPGRDLVKLAVLERHHATGRVGLGFATNVGLRRGAFASSVAHDAHNVVVLGVDDGDMAACVGRLAELGGGVVVAEGRRVVAELPLPVAGLLSDLPLADVHRRLTEMQRLVRGMGVLLDAPFMSLSFLALSVIPELKLTDRGLVDVARSRVVPLSAGGD